MFPANLKRMWRKRRDEKRLAAAIHRGRTLQVEQRYDEFHQFLQEAVQQFPDDPAIRLLYATSLLDVRSGDVVPEAIKAVELAPNDPMILTQAASLIFNQGAVERARPYVTRAEELAPEDFIFTAELKGLAGQLRAHDGDDEFAEEALRAAVNLKPDQEALARHLAEFLADRYRMEEAVEVIDRALKLTKKKEHLERLRVEMAGPSDSGES